MALGVGDGCEARDEGVEVGEDGCPCYVFGEGEEACKEEKLGFLWDFWKELEADDTEDYQL